MCTVVLLVGVNPDYPLIVAANRDELLARPWTAPALVAPGVVAPRDGVAGGTWMGATAGGFFAALTNVHAPGPAPRSRGQVVLDVLLSGELDAAEELLGWLPPATYGPFNLLFGEAGRVRLCRSAPGAARVKFEDVPPGLRILPNGPLDAPLVPKVTRAQALIGPHVARPWAELAPILHRALGDHESDSPYGALCVHQPAFGTSSSTVLAITAGRTAAYLFAPGPPCVTPLDDVTSLLGG